VSPSGAGGWQELLEHTRFLSATGKARRGGKVKAEDFVKKPAW
jgi:hypothetical protein